MLYKFLDTFINKLDTTTKLAGDPPTAVD